MRLREHGPPGGLVHAPALHPDQAVLDDVLPPHPVRAGEAVEVGHQRDRVQGAAVHGGRRPALEPDLDDRGGVGRPLRIHGQPVHPRRRLGPRILEDAALEAQMPEILVHAVGPLAGHRHRHPVGARVLDLLLTRAEGPLPPRRDHRQVGGQGLIGQLEAHLVVPFAGAPVRERIAPLGERHLHLDAGDERPRERGPEEVPALVDGVRPQRGEDVLRHELAANVHHLDRIGAAAPRLGSHLVEVVPLADVGHDGDDRAAVPFLEPGDDHGGVEAAAVGQGYPLGLDHRPHLTDRPRGPRPPSPPRRPRRSARIPGSRSPRRCRRAPR